MKRPAAWRRALLAAAAVSSVSLGGAMLATHPARPLDIGHRGDAAGSADAELSSTGCGVERWAVKTGSDGDRYKVDQSISKKTNIPALRRVVRPSSTFPADRRLYPYEMTQYWLPAYLVKFKREDDGDYHLVLENSTGETLVVELPDPSCVSSTSTMRSAIVSTRRGFDSRYAATTSWKYAGRRYVELRGPAFWDYLHNQTGMAPNGIEIHPVLSIRLG